MATFKDKNLLFYSIHPNDEYSRELLIELDKNPSLKKQFILVCVNDPKIIIPDKIRQLNRIPVLIASGINRPIFGTDAVSWLKNDSFKNKALGFDYGSLEDDKSSSYARLGDELKTSDYNQFFNTDYNHGFFEKDTSLKEAFTSIVSDTSITTFDDSSEMKKNIQAQLDQKLAQLRQTRDTDVPRPIRRIGMEDMPPVSTSSKSQYENAFNNMSGGGNGSGHGDGPPAPRYNPNPFATNIPPTLPTGLNVPPPPYMSIGRGVLPPSQPTYIPMGRGAPTAPYGAGTGPRLPFAMTQPGRPSGLSLSNGPQLPFPMVGQGRGFTYS